MVAVSRELLPAQRDKSLQLGKEVFVHLNKLDAAAADNNQLLASTNYTEALKDFDAFNDLLPELPRAAAPVETAAEDS
jgi:hypothetical protein